ncbi:TPA: hypothetical protein ACH3X2_007590 [Trebouxia sp. C0005]
MQAECTNPSHSQNEVDLRKQLSRALLHFQDRLLEANISPGSLCQVWMPEMSEEGEQVLKAKGQPYCAAGVVDLLALFRCISCRYCFSTDLTKPELLGAPGRVFTSRQPEMTRNVQQQSKDVYLRAQEALHCRVHSTLVLPLYRHPDRGQVAGILEVIQTSEDMVFSDLVEILSQVLEQCSLYTCDQLQRDRMRKTLPHTVAVSASTSKGDNSTHMSASQNGSSHDSPKSMSNQALGRNSASPERVGETNNQMPRLPEHGDNSVHKPDAQTRAGTLYAQLAQQQLMAAAGRQHELGNLVTGPYAAAAALEYAQAPHSGMVTRHNSLQKITDELTTRDSNLSTYPEDSKISSGYDDEEIGSEDGEGWEDDMEDSAEGAGSGDANSRLANRRRGKGTGNPGKPGKKLRLADLQSQFGVGLKEAANKLGICPTTLKRACRRHGIQRWPRRQLARLTRAIDQIRSSGGNSAPAIPGTMDRPLRSSSRGRAASEGAALTSPGRSLESAPTSPEGAAYSEPGPDTRWSALNQLIPTFSNPLDEGSIHGPSKTSTPVLSALPAPAQDPSLSPALIHQPHSSPHDPALELAPAMITAEPAEQVGDLGLQIGLSSLAGSGVWTPCLKDDPWSTNNASKIASASMIAEPDTSTMQLDSDSCCLSLGDAIATAEDETVHGNQSFQRHMSLRPFGHYSSGLTSMANSTQPHHANSGSMFDQGGLAIPSMAGRGSGGLTSAHRMAASHSPHLEEGLLAQSLENHLPALASGRMPGSLPNLAGASSMARSHMALNMGHLGLGTSHSMAAFPQDMLSHTLQTQRDSQYQQEVAARSMSAQLPTGSPFELNERDTSTHFGEQAMPLHSFGGEEMTNDMGLMDGDMLEMLLKPE